MLHSIWFWRRYVLIGACVAALGTVTELFAGQGGSSGARGQVTLTIADNTGGRVPNATVLARQASAQLTLATDRNGVLRMDDLTPGEWLITVVAQGFVAVDRTIRVTLTPVQLTVTLDVAGVSESVQVEGTAPGDPIQLSRLATGGTLLDIPVRELPLSLSVVTQEMMIERGARTDTEAVELAVGMTTQTTGNQSPSYATRGFDVEVTRDGMRQLRSGSNRALDTFLFDRIEVLKGPASVLYGESTIGGAVNYVSKAPRSTFGGEALLSYGSFGTYRTGIGVNLPVGSKIAARIDASRSDKDGYVERSGQQLDALAATVRWSATDRFSVSATGSYGAEDGQSYDGTPYINGVVDRRTRRINYEMQNNATKSYVSFSRLDLDGILRSGWRLHNQVFAATHRRDSRSLRGFTYNAARNQVDVSSYFLLFHDDVLVGDRFDAQNTFDLFGRKTHFVAGGEMRHNDLIRSRYSSSTIRYSVDPFNPAPITDPGFDYLPQYNALIETKAVFTEGLVDVTGRLKVVGGLRWERIDVDFKNFEANRRLATVDTPVTGRTGVVFDVTPNANVYASYSRAIEPATGLTGLTDTTAEYSMVPGRQWEVGTKAAALGQRLDMTLAYYAIEKRDILTTSLIDGISTGQQIGRQTSRGVELAVGVAPIGPLRMSGDVAWTDANFADFIEIVSGRNVSRSGNTPPGVAAFIANFNPSLRFGPVDVSTRIRRVSDRWGDNANTRRIGGYTTVDAATTYHFGDGRYDVTLRGRNLTDELYTPGSSSSATQIRLADPRSADVSLSIRF